MLETRQNQDVLEFVLVGAMDSATCPEIKEEILAKLAENPARVAFDLKAVDFIASIFLSLCLIVSQKVGEGNFSVVNPQPQIKKVFKIAGLDKFVK
ncbi:MAG: STAS domain-containing protein [Planctomycetes bacterium]|nr:STAS domain-containing protein [Planctomycetota bacterium]